MKRRPTEHLSHAARLARRLVVVWLCVCVDLVISFAHHPVGAGAAAPVFAFAGAVLLVLLRWARPHGPK